MPFPKTFTWGVSAASYQIEGAAYEDGKGLSVWDMFCRKQGAVWHGHSGDVACDHYHRYKEDVALMKALGVGAYRLSLSWPRLIPAGTGRINPKGVDFYSRLFDALLDAGIQPWVTLFHWDYPYDLFCRGGWLNPDSSDWFADYARTAAEQFSDRVDHWFTHNEPQCFIGLGHQDGRHAPGIQLPLHEVLQAGHHALLAHGKAVQSIRATAKSPAEIGYAVASQVKIPASNRPEDIAAARQAFDSVSTRDCWNNAWWMDPVYKGCYPADGLQLYGADAPDIKAGDMETINQPLDLCGSNVYQGQIIEAGPDGEPRHVLPPPGYNRTSQTDWHVTPPSIYWATKWFYERYGVPIVISENGHQNLDAVALDGNVHDPQRIDYIHRYLLELERIIDDGVPVKGYFYWTLMDNFEWALGYSVRVGLVHTDFQSLERTPKDSYAFYRDVVSSNGSNLH